ncbi:hypothetical protein CP533_0417 [Ophiocordyceps camponoti-saundersi (nom. inval.)]|nr:hypothetical protein CP533_0417 [Ophiocordyceps camponoti-saundersi (nom. inval.)]
MDEYDEEVITLSDHSFTALAEFTAERHMRETEFAIVRAEAEIGAQSPLSIESFAEDWNESQFWYSEKTANVLATQLIEGSTNQTRIGLISAPSVYLAIKKMLHSCQESERPQLVLLEHDRRFNICTDFVYYNYQNPEKLPSKHPVMMKHYSSQVPNSYRENMTKFAFRAASLRGSMDRVFCDPPFLTATTVHWLLKPFTAGCPYLRVVVCTGQQMSHFVTEFYKPLGVVATTFEPKHVGGLGNDFLCYANFESSSWNCCQRGS